MATYSDARQVAQGSTCVITGHDSSYDVVNENEVVYDFSTYTAGTQYAKGEVHKLDDNTTLTVNGGHLNSQLRIYVDSNAVISSEKALSSISIYAGHKDATLVVKASVDGETWVEVTTLTITSAFADHDIDLGNAGYKYLELTATGGQVRIKTATIVCAE